MADLTEEQRQYYQEMFDDFDEDQSGFLDRDEVVQLMMVCGANPTEEDVDNYMQEVDKSDLLAEDGKISFDEFCVFMTKDPDPEATLREAFAQLDRDGSGYLDRSEVEDILNDYRDDDDFKELVERALSDDGKIIYEEFARLMMNRETGKSEETRDSPGVSMFS